MTTRGGRPTTDQVAKRETPAPAQKCETTGRIVCRSCGKPKLVRYGGPTKEGAHHYRCGACGQRHTMRDDRLQRI